MTNDNSIDEKFLHTKYPPVNSTPSVEDCLRSLRISDYLQWGGATVGSWGYGFMVGKPARFVMAGLMAGIGFTFGSLVVLQNTRGRLLGLRENQREIKLYGSQPSVVAREMQWKNY